VEKGRSLEAIFGELDAMKFRSSVEMFGVRFATSAAAGDPSLR
jgi:uncharacterized protein (DUF1810 family)